jgi:hypothetical protein
VSSRQNPAAKRRTTVAVKKTAPRKRPPLRDVKTDPPPKTDAPYGHLRQTERPGVYQNESGAYVNEQGVLLSLSILRHSEEEYAQNIIGKKVETPAELLKRVALDPMLPLMVRLDAAKAAAPYYDKKTPIAVENKNEDLALDVVAISKLPKAKRLELLEVLKTMGVDIGVRS